MLYENRNKERMAKQNHFYKGRGRRLIIYFSASGNSKFVALNAATLLNDEIICLNDRIKNNDNSELHSDTPFVLVCPVYAWRIPRIVEEYLLNVRLTGSNRIYLLVTTCGSSGNTGYYAKCLSERIGKKFMGWHTFFMPGSYVAFMENPDVAHAKEMNLKAIEELKRLLPYIEDEQPLPAYPVTAIGKFMSLVANPLFYKFIIGRRGFYTTESCIGCGKCATVCPLNNIVMDGKKPKWGDNCTHCMACIHQCPVQATEFRKITVGKNRYYNSCNS